jgi:tRNA dimethylallyltransferase
MKNTVYIIAGPTAVGKSLIAQYLAKRIGGEIVNCDSIQLYKYFDIGSAKPSKSDMDAVPHHLYGVVDPRNQMTAAAYQKVALKVIDNILARGKTPILCGGTGLYLNSVLYDMDFAAVPRDGGARRKELEEMAEERGGQYMYDFLSALDADSASRIHPNNTRKVIRAIEAFEQGSGVKNLNQCPLRQGYDFRFFGIIMDREWLYERINKRVIKLIKSGLLDEIKNLKKMGFDQSAPARKAIGYKELFAYYNGEIPELKDAILEVMKNSRHYAKRQLTWLKRYGDMIHWIEIRRQDSVGSIVDRILETK